MAYRIGIEKRGDRAIHTLHDDATGASAAVLPSYGFNLFDLRLPVADKVRPVLDALPDFAENPRSAGRNGTPVLFPFPNRIARGKYRFGGKDYELPLNLGPNAIHGFAIDTPWEVIEHRATNEGAEITGRWQLSRHAASSVSHWPTDAMLQITYRLAGRRLTLDATITNPTAHPLPMGFGIHPYFRLPFDPQGDNSRTKVILPASQFWVLEEFLPTGERRSVDARLDFRAGQPIAGLKLDDVLTGLKFEGKRCVCRLVDDNLNAEFRLSFGEGFRELVVYTPPGDGRVISLEPYTQTTDAINLQTRSIDAGLRVLKHDETVSFSIAMETLG